MPVILSMLLLIVASGMLTSLRPPQMGLAQRSLFRFSFLARRRVDALPAVLLSSVVLVTALRSLPLSRRLELELRERELLVERELPEAELLSVELSEPELLVDLELELSEPELLSLELSRLLLLLREALPRELLYVL